MNQPQHRLEKAIGYTFQDPQRLKQALTHCSAPKPHNERLEFLGDSVLNFVVAEYIFRHYPQATEGMLTRMRSRLVNGRTLAIIAKSWSLEQYLILGTSERRAGGIAKESIQADAVEAIIGAMYLESDLSTVQERILAWLGSRIDEVASTAREKDPKTELQERMQAAGLTLPVYTVLTIDGPQHKQSFSVNCQVEGLDSPTEGKGNSRRTAEQDAAAKALVSLKNDKSG